MVVKMKCWDKQPHNGRFRVELHTEHGGSKARLFLSPDLSRQLEIGRECQLELRPVEALEKPAS